MCFESFVEDGEWICCLDIGREFVSGARTEMSRNFAEQALLALSDGGTGWLADVVE